MSTDTPTPNDITAEKSLTEREQRMLLGLYRWQKVWAKYTGARPLDLGGRNGSDHSYLLNRLVKYGLVERKARSPLTTRGSYRYALTEAGQALAVTLLPERERPAA